MSEPTIGLVIPTVGRPTLARTLASLREQAWGPGDVVLVVGDGPQLIARELARQVGGVPIRYIETPRQMGEWGHGVREWVQAERLLTTSHRWQLDDDDAARPQAIQAIRTAAREHPGRPLLFQMDFRRQQWDRPLVWNRPELTEGNVGTPCLVAPVGAPFDRPWSPRYGGDYDHIRAVCESHPAGPVWRPEVICVCRPHLPAPPEDTTHAPRQ